MLLTFGIVGTLCKRIAQCACQQNQMHVKMIDDGYDRQKATWRFSSSRQAAGMKETEEQSLGFGRLCQCGMRDCFYAGLVGSWTVLNTLTQWDVMHCAQLLIRPVER